ncbi:hypothetical protein ZWY2020_055290 [Hordeum vulgare]|nr:hypothetical protein ZWY2020_055290 [Hordeum vulgare]
MPDAPTTGRRPQHVIVIVIVENSSSTSLPDSCAALGPGSVGRDGKWRMMAPHNNLAQTTARCISHKAAPSPKDDVKNVATQMITKRILALGLLICHVIQKAL